MKQIDLSNWKRATHYGFFKRMDYPHHSITTNLDVTKFLQKCNSNNLPFYYAMIYFSTEALNSVEEFRYRMRGEHVVLHEKVHPSFTDMAEAELFKMVTVDLTGTVEGFCRAARIKSQEQKDYFIKEDVADRDDLIYFSCSPWVSFTGITHTISFHKDDSIPRIAWGKHFESGEKRLLPFSVQAHHSFVDGIHMGKYIDALQAMIEQ